MACGMLVSRASRCTSAARSATVSRGGGLHALGSGLRGFGCVQQRGGLRRRGGDRGRDLLRSLPPPPPPSGSGPAGCLSPGAAPGGAGRLASVEARSRGSTRRADRLLRLG